MATNVIPWLIDTVTQKLRRFASGEVVSPSYLPDATTSVKGALAPADKVKIDAIATDIAAAVATETTNRIADVNAEETARIAAVSAEAAARAAADTAEQSARIAADAAEALTRSNADTAETNARTAADTALENALDAHVGAGGAEHPNVTEATSGFASAQDKQDIEDLERVRAWGRANGSPITEEFPYVEVLQVFGQNRWRAGTSTADYASAYFYAEVPGSLSYTSPNVFSSTSNLALYSPIGVPNSGSPNHNAPSNTEAELQASIYWDEGIPIPPNAFVGGSVLDVELFGQLKVNRTGKLYLVLDPDGDVRVAETGDNSTLAAETQKVFGADPAVQIAELGTCADDGSGKVVVTLNDHGLSNGDRFWLTTGYKAEGMLPDLVDGGYYYASNVTTHTFKPSTTHPSSPGPATLVDYNRSGGLDAESLLVVVTKLTSSGSWKQIKFAFDLATVTSNSDFVPVRIRIQACADGRGNGDTEDGVLWYAVMETFEVSDRIGTSTTTVAVSEGATASKVWRAAAARTSPGKGYVTPGALWPTAAPMLLASNDYDGAGTDAFITTAHDFGGQWDEIYTTEDLVATLPFRSITNSVNNVDATATLLYVGGQVVGEVYEVRNARRLVRYRPLSEDTRIKNGDVVTFQIFRKVSNVWSAVTGETDTFVAAGVRLGPQTTKLAIRAAMDGSQNGGNVLDIRGGVAKLTRTKGN